MFPIYTLRMPSKPLDVFLRCVHLPPRLVLKLLFGPGAEKRITEKPPQHLGTWRKGRVAISELCLTFIVYNHINCIHKCKCSVEVYGIPF